MAYRRFYKRKGYKRRYGRKIGKAYRAGRGTHSAFNMKDNYSRGCVWA